MKDIKPDRNRAQRDTQADWVAQEELVDIKAYISIRNGVLYFVPATNAGSNLLDDFFGKQVGDDGLIFEGPCNVQVKLSDGYATHYMSLVKERGERPTAVPKEGQASLHGAGKEVRQETRDATDVE